MRKHFYLLEPVSAASVIFNYRYEHKEFNDTPSKCSTSIEGVFELDDSRKSLTICPHHRDTCGTLWKSGKLRCSVPSAVAGHKSSSAKGDRSLSSEESHYILMRMQSLIQIGTCE